MRPQYVIFAPTAARERSRPSEAHRLASEGAKPGSEDAKAIADAKKSEGPFMVRHLEKCGRKGGMVVGVYPDDPRWKKLDPKKREN